MPSGWSSRPMNLATIAALGRRMRFGKLRAKANAPFARGSVAHSTEPRRVTGLALRQKADAHAGFLIRRGMFAGFLFGCSHGDTDIASVSALHFAEEVLLAIAVEGHARLGRAGCFIRIGDDHDAAAILQAPNDLELVGHELREFIVTGGKRRLANVEGERDVTGGD